MRGCLSLMRFFIDHNMHNEKRATGLSFRAFILTILVLVFLVAYPLIIATVTGYFQSELDQLKLSHEQLKNAIGNDDAGEPSRRDKCICDTGNATDQGHVTGNDIDDTMTGSLLRCCTADQETLKWLVSEVLTEEKRRNREKTRERRHTTQRAIISVATHVTGTTDCFRSSLGKPIGEMFKVGRWAYTTGVAFSDKVASDGFHMIVPKPGIYHVYSKVVFKDHSESDSDFNGYIHCTVLISTAYSNKNIDIMRSDHIREGPGTRVSSFHSGLFELREDDKIYMKVYLPSSDFKIDCEQKSTYMGMYLVSDQMPF